MWNSGSVNLGLNEAFSLWLSVLLVMLLSSLMMVMLFVLVSLKNQLESIRWQLN
jgi:hypothetical protein